MGKHYVGGMRSAGSGQGQDAATRVARHSLPRTSLMFTAIYYATITPRYLLICGGCRHTALRGQLMRWLQQNIRQRAATGHSPNTPATTFREPCAREYSLLVDAAFQAFMLL